MIKQEVATELRKLAKKGHITHFILLEIFEDGEEIPDDFIKLCLSSPRAQHIDMLCGEEMLNKLNSMIQDGKSKA